MKFAMVHFINIILTVYLTNYCYTSTTSSDGLTRFDTNDHELVEQIYSDIGKYIEDETELSSYIEQQIEKIHILPQPVNDNVLQDPIVNDNVSQDHVVQVIKVHDIVKKIESNKPRKQIDKLNVDVKNIYSQYDNESIAKSLQEIKDFTPETIPNMSEYIPVKDVIKSNKANTLTINDENNIDKFGLEIKGIVSEILNIIRTSSEVSTDHNKIMQEFIDKYNTNQHKEDLLVDLLNIISILEKEKFPFSKEGDFIKYATDKNAEAITYSDIHENKWVWRPGNNSVDNFNSTTEKRISGDYRKNNMLVRFHKIMRDNKISDNYEEVINEEKYTDTVSNTTPYQPNSLNTDERSSTYSEDISSNGSQCIKRNPSIFISLMVSIMFIL